MSAVQSHPLLESFLKHQYDLLGFLSYKLNCPETAAELVQETYLRVARYPEAEEIQNPRALMFRIANNLALDYLRKHALTTPIISRGVYNEPLAETIDEPAVTVNAMQQLEHLELLIEALPPSRRQVFLLSRVEGKSYNTIAQELGISERTVENHVYKALKTLKARFAEYE